MSKKVIAIIQARMGSSRLPGKVLKTIKGRPMLWHVVKRVSSAELIDSVIIATSTKAKDDKIEEFSRSSRVKVYRGSENDVLDRYYKAAKEAGADVIVRITADCALICPEVIDKVVSEFLKSRCDYATNGLVYTYPDGCDTEVFSLNALAKAWQECGDAAQREHVTPYIRNSGKFKLRQSQGPAIRNQGVPISA